MSADAKAAFYDYFYYGKALEITNNNKARIEQLADISEARYKVGKAMQTTVTGILTDDMCTKKHMMPGKANADCVRDCVKHGAKYVVSRKADYCSYKGTKARSARSPERK